MAYNESLGDRRPDCEVEVMAAEPPLNYTRVVTKLRARYVNDGSCNEETTLYPWNNNKKYTS